MKRIIKLFIFIILLFLFWIQESFAVDGTQITSSAISNPVQYNGNVYYTNDWVSWNIYNFAGSDLTLNSRTNIPTPTYLSSTYSYYNGYDVSVTGWHPTGQLFVYQRVNPNFQGWFASCWCTIYVTQLNAQEIIVKNIIILFTTK